MFKFWHGLTQLSGQSMRPPWQRFGIVATGLALGIFVAIATLLPQTQTLDTQVLKDIPYFSNLHLLGKISV